MWFSGCQSDSQDKRRNGDKAYAKVCSDFTSNLSEESRSGGKSAGLGLCRVLEIIMSHPENESPSHRLDGRRWASIDEEPSPLASLPFHFALRQAYCSRRHRHFVTVFLSHTAADDTDIQRANWFSPVLLNMFKTFINIRTWRRFIVKIRVYFFFFFSSFFVGCVLLLLTLESLEKKIQCEQVTSNYRYSDNLRTFLVLILTVKE